MRYMERVSILRFTEKAFSVAFHQEKTVFLDKPPHNEGEAHVIKIGNKNLKGQPS